MALRSSTLAALRCLLEDHNVFEEAVLFPLICARGGGELASLLTHEHVIIGPLARRVRGIAARILEDGIDADRWAEFQSAATDLVAEMMAHLQKEELTVVQRLRAFLDREAAIREKCPGGQFGHPLLIE